MGVTGVEGACGHEVTGFARNIAKVFQADNVKAEAADVNAPAFAGQLKGYDAVVAAYNAGWENPNLSADLEQGWASILAAAKAAEVPYLLVIGGAGSLNAAPDLQLVDTPDFPKEVYPAANAVRNLLNELRERRDINWAFLSPAAMFAVNPVRFEKTGRYVTGKDDVLFNGDVPADISVADLAFAIADDVENKAHLFERFTVAEAV